MIPIVRPDLPPLEEYVALLEQIWDSKMLSNFAGFSTQMEEIAQSYLGADHALTCTSGETGLMIALAALELPPGSPCFLTSFTFNSTINAALWNKLTPVFVDIDPDTFTMSASSLSKAMRRHTAPGVVLATHVFGNPCDVNALETLSRSHNCYLLFDAAHGYGSLRDGQHVGTFGDAEIFSLSGTKLVTTAEGGLITTPHDWMAERLRYLRAHGFQGDYNSKVLGLNGKFSELHAALGTLTLSKVEDAVACRHEQLAQYRAALPSSVGWQAVRPEDRSTYKDICLVLGSRRDVVEARLTEQDIQTKRYFRPLHGMELFGKYQDTPLPVTEKLYNESLCVPAYRDMPEWVIGAVAEAVEQADAKVLA